MGAGGNLSALLVDLSGLQFGNALLSALGIPNREIIECFVLDAGMQRGLITPRTFFLDTDASRIGVNGTVSLYNEAMALKIETDSKHFSVGTLPTPIDVTGTFSTPHIRPEAGPLAVRGGAAIALGIIGTPLAALLPTDPVRHRGGWQVWLGAPGGADPAAGAGRAPCRGTADALAVPGGAAPGEAGLVQIGQGSGVVPDAFGHGHGGAKLAGVRVPDRRPAHRLRPGTAQCVVEAHPHEAVVEPDRPALGCRHPGQDRARQVQPARDELLPLGAVVTRRQGQASHAADPRCRR